MSGEETRGRCPERRDLLGLLRGEAATAEVLALRDHLLGCGRCRAELVEVAVGHSLLGAAGRTLSEPAPVPRPVPPTLPVPDVGGRSRRRAGLALAGAAAAVLLVLGGATVGVLVADAPEPAPRAPVAAPQQQADLEAVGPVPGRGVVTMADPSGGVAEMTVRTRGLPRPSAGEFYYAWLLDPETSKMLPVGQVEAEGSATFRLPLSLLGRYSAIDVSLETDDGDPGHSPTSVLRAAYSPPSTTSS